MTFQSISVWLLFAIAFADAKLSCQPQTQPKNVICGVRGKAKNVMYEYAANTAAVQSLDQCRDLCFRHLAGAFSFNEANGLCNLYGRITLKYIKKDATSHTVFYNKDCFKCAPESCDPDKVVNLLDNGGFEASTRYIGPWGATAGDSTVINQAARPAQPGSHSAIGLNVSGIWMYYDQYFRECFGQTHRAEVDVYNAHNTNGTAGSFFIGAYTAASFSTLISTPRYPSSLPAKKLVAFYTPRNLHGYIGPIRLSGGNVFYDNVVVRPVDLSSAKPIGKNAVINGGFETRAKPWNYSARDEGKNKGTFKIISPGLDGSSKALQWKQGSDKFSFLTLKLKPTVNESVISIGKLHRLSFSTDKPVVIGLRFADGTEIYGMTTHDHYFYAEEGMFPLRIDIDNDDDEVRELTFDNLSIREIEDD